MDLAVEMRNLKKHFGTRKAVDGVSIEVHRGECFGILGPNGAGKTTLLKMMSGSALPQEGELFVLGLPVTKSLREMKNRIGVVPQSDGLDAEFTVRENLDVFGRFFALAPGEKVVRVNELLRMSGLERRADELVENLSGGLKRRVAIIRALLHRPELLILDEPTVALDPQARQWIWDFLKKQRDEKITCVLTTHYMDEAQTLCDRIALIHSGRVITIGTPQAVIEEHWGHEVVEVQVPRSDFNYYSNRLKEKGLPYQILGERFLIGMNTPQDAPEVLKMFPSLKFTLRKPDLNDVFLKMTGSDLRDGGAE